MRVYRFRKCDFRNDPKNPGSHLQSELEKSEIYFSKLSQLNDPMEGLKDILTLVKN